MKYKIKLPVFVIIIFFCLILNVFPGDNISKKGNRILEQIDRSLMPVSYESYRKLINIEPDGRKKEFVLYTIKRGANKLAMLYLSPPIDKDKATLRLGDNMWLYMPNIGKPLRITSIQSVTGGVFSNADIMLLDYHVEYNAVNLEEKDDEYYLMLKAKTNAVAYDKLKMWVKKSGTIVKSIKKVECYSASNMLLKTLEFKNIKDFGGNLVRPSVIETYSPLYKGYKSYMIILKVKERIFPHEVFSLNYLPRLKNLK